MEKKHTSLLHYATNRDKADKDQSSTIRQSLSSTRNDVAVDKRHQSTTQPCHK